MVGDEQLDRAFRKILLAPRIESERVGYAMEPSEIHQAWQRVRHEVPIETLIDAFDDATPAGKAYFLGRIEAERPDEFLRLRHLLHDESRYDHLDGDQGFGNSIAVRYLWGLLNLVHVKTEALETCVACVAEESMPDEVRFEAFKRLAKSHPDRVRAVAERWLESEDLELRSIALDSRLVDKPDPEWILFNTGYSTALQELRTFIHLKPPELKQLLERVMRVHPNEQMRYVALDAYVELPDADPEILLERIGDEDSRVPRRLVYGLIRVSPADAARVLLQMLREGDYTGDLVKVMLGINDDWVNVDPIPLENRLHEADTFAAHILADDDVLLEDSGWLAAHTVLDYMQGRPHPTLIALTFKLLKHPNLTTPSSASQALKELGLKKCRDALQEALEDEQSVAHATATEIVHEYGLDDFSLQRALAVREPTKEEIFHEMFGKE